jgi:hypothetical protein
MAIYRVSGTVTISCFTDVEANSPEEAKEKALDVEFCNLGSPKMFGQGPSDHWVHSGEIDGDPKVEDAEELT